MQLVPMDNGSEQHLAKGRGNAEHHRHMAHQEKHDHDEVGNNKHEGHHTGDFLKRFWVSLMITLPILLLSHMIQQWLGVIDNFLSQSFTSIGAVVNRSNIAARKVLEKAQFYYKAPFDVLQDLYETVQP